MGIARPQAALGERVDELGRGAEVRDALLLGEIEQDPAVARERRAVVEHQRRLGAKPGEEHVPHHPVGGAEVEVAVARPHVEVQLEGLQRLQQRAAGAVHDALRLAGRARGEQHEHRVVERQLRVRRCRRAGSGAATRRAAPPCGTSDTSTSGSRYGTTTTLRTSAGARRSRARARASRASARCSGSRRRRTAPWARSGRSARARRRRRNRASTRTRRCPATARRARACWFRAGSE